MIRWAPLSTFPMAFAGVGLAGLTVVGVALSPIVRHTALGFEYWLFPALLLVFA